MTMDGKLEMIDRSLEGQSGRETYSSRRTEQRVNSYPSHGQSSISRRLSELDTEFSLEQVCAVASGLFSLCTLWLAPRRVTRSLALGLAVPGLITLALARRGQSRQWLKRLAFRSRKQIDAEKFALKIVRGDFDCIEDEFHRRACAMNVIRSGV